MVKITHEQFNNLKAYLSKQDEIDEVIYLLENNFGNTSELLAQAENIRMNLDEIAKYKVVDKDNLSNILIRLEKLNNILGNEITVVENKINTVNLKK